MQILKDNLMDKNVKNTTKIAYVGIPLLVVLNIIYKFNDLHIINLILYQILIIFGYIATVNDIKNNIITNKLVVAMYGVWLATVLTSMVFDINQGIYLLEDGVKGFLVGGGLFMFVYIISRKGIGAGDVKFMSAVGLYIGANFVFSAIFYGTVLAGLYSVVLMVFKKLNMKSTLPLAPFLYTAILLLLFFA